MAPQFLGAHEVVALVSLLFALVICLNARSLGSALSVVDVPDADRKRHAQPTPLVGGLAIIIPVMLWQAGELLLFPTGDFLLQKVLLLCGAGAAVMGFIDDQTPTYPVVRLLSLLIFVGIAFAIDPTLIAPALQWTSSIATAIPLWGYLALMSISVVGLVNAANMADGQNGLLTGMFLTWSLCLWLVSSGESYCPLILMGAAAIVFLFNVPGRLFLGDCGSYGVTFVIAVLSIRAHADGALTVGTVVVWFFIPIADCLRLMISRGLSGRSPLSADRDHFHHRLEARFGANSARWIYLSSVAATSILVTLVPDLTLALIALLSMFYGAAIWMTTEKAPQQIVFRFDHVPTAAPSGSVVRLSKATPDADERAEFADGAYGAQEASHPYAERKSARQAG